MINRSQQPEQDRGAILPLVLVMAVVIAVVITSLATYVSTSLRYGNVVEARADRLAAADGGLRYAIERLGNSQYAACLSKLGTTGYTIDFPAKVNGATVDVTCTKGSYGIGDIKAWAIIVTGEGVPNGQPSLLSQGGGGKTKLLGGPVWVTDPDQSHTDLKVPVQIEDGDIWYYRPDCTNPSLTYESTLTFTPAYRGTICVNKPWTSVYEAPAIGSFPAATDTANTDPAPFIDSSGCRIFKPGRYTVAPVLGTNNYFQSGNYYFHNVLLSLDKNIVTAGWADNIKYGDQQAIANFECSDAISKDSTSGSAPGATFYMGGSSRISIDNKGSFEILRRLQGDSLVSVQALDSSNADYTASSLGWNTNMIYTKPGSNSDLAIHGLLWAPRAQLEFGNVTNAANGQLLGGAAVARVILQASASASAFQIRVETSGIAYELRLDSTATLDGQSTTMTAVVQIDDQGVHAVRSLRVRD